MCRTDLASFSNSNQKPKAKEAKQAASSRRSKAQLNTALVVVVVPLDRQSFQHRENNGEEE
jgi:hypothetical protein